MSGAVSRSELIREYNRVVQGTDEQATSQEQRAYGGVVRAAKGKLVEKMARGIIRLGWDDIGGTRGQLSFGDFKKCQVHVTDDYIARLRSPIADYIRQSRSAYCYKAHVDIHVFVDNIFVLGVECKAYAENAMLKRILVDFKLLKSRYPNLVCCLLQLESMLGGQYSDPLASPQLGSPSSHTLMSMFPELDLNIVTLLRGERKVDQPIHKPAFFKPLESDCLDQAIVAFGTMLRPFV